jgi:uncharacterized membrane protein
MAETRASIAGHPIHVILVVLPLGLWVGGAVCDVVHAATGGAAWATAAFYMIGLGVLGALLAAVPGFIDFVGLTGRAGRLATWHMGLNLLAVALFAVNWAARTPMGTAWIGAGSSIPLALSIVGVVIIAVSGWLGGELVYSERLGVREPEDQRAAQRRRAA